VDHRVVRPLLYDLMRAWEEKSVTQVKWSVSYCGRVLDPFPSSH
jgi:hypothetical protein